MVTFGYFVWFFFILFCLFFSIEYSKLQGLKTPHQDYTEKAQFGKKEKRKVLRPLMLTPPRTSKPQTALLGVGFCPFHYGAQKRP